MCKLQHARREKLRREHRRNSTRTKYRLWSVPPKKRGKLTTRPSWPYRLNLFELHGLFGPYDSMTPSAFLDGIVLLLSFMCSRELQNHIYSTNQDGLYTPESNCRKKEQILQSILISYGLFLLAIFTFFPFLLRGGLAVRPQLCFKASPSLCMENSVSERNLFAFGFSVACAHLAGRRWVDDQLDARYNFDVVRSAPCICR